MLRRASRIKLTTFNNIVLLSTLTPNQLRTIWAFVLFGFVCVCMCACVCVCFPLSQFDFLRARCRDKLRHGQTHRSRGTKKDDTHQALLRSVAAVPSILVYRHMGKHWQNVRQMLQSSSKMDRLFYCFFFCCLPTCVHRSCTRTSED